MNNAVPKTVYLKDYKPAPYNAEHIDLSFRIEDTHTLVDAVTTYSKASGGTLMLNGEHMKLHAVILDGRILEKGKDYTVDDKILNIICELPDTFNLSIATEIDPAANTRLEGLYKSGGNWCTQCEAEGFRTITYFQDRPDVMATFTVRIEADKNICPVLLSNGNLIDSGSLDGGLHFAVWDDPFPKPCYLFALVAGDLVYIEDEFKTRSGNKVDLRIYVRKGDESQCGHAMQSLKSAMKWDEDVYGREYNYDIFNIVAVSDFNMGAMENTSLNIFNTALVLAHQDTATDSDFLRVEGVIAHEYFHNWTGNRITCRDWFQLSLKEGLTVFRDQEFTADMNSRGVKRIDDVAMLRRMQFAEDAGPMAHPIRPDNYIEINNFYTVTVYEKGAEVIRMLHSLLGAETYRKATDLYFERHDGQAVTCEDFVKCMEDASGRDLSQFFRWYQQAGTPVITAKGSYDKAKRRYKLTLTQNIPDTPGQTGKKPHHIPVCVGLVGANGHDMADKMLELTEHKQEFVFEKIGSEPIPSILRGFSAPVKLEQVQSEDDLRFLMVHDSDSFNRWEAGQNYFLSVIQGVMNNKDSSAVPESFLSAYEALLDNALKPDADKAFMARMIGLPTISAIAQHQETIDPDAIHEAREILLDTIAGTFEDKLDDLYRANRSGDGFSITPAAMGQRALQNTVLHIMSNRLTVSDAVRALAQYKSANNMTDRMAAFMVGCALDGGSHDEIVRDFYYRFKDYQLVIDKWFSAQATVHQPKTMDVVKALRDHPDFTMKNPNRVRALIGAFAMNNPVRFHDVSGEGYDFLTDAIIELNTINPQIASRMMTPLRDWKRYTPDRKKLMKASLQRILDTRNLSNDVFEIVSKSLN